MTADSLDAALAERMTRAARAAQDLCDVLWEALHEELSDRSPNGPRAQRVADLSARVADISSSVAALAGYATQATLEREPSTTAEPPPRPGPAPTPEPPSTPEPSTALEPAAAPGAPSGAVIVDERAASSDTGRSSSDPLPEPRVAREELPTAREHPTRARPLPWDEPLSEEMRVTRRTVEKPAAAGPPDAPF